MDSTSTVNGTRPHIRDQESVSSAVSRLQELLDEGSIQIQGIPAQHSWKASAPDPQDVADEVASIIDSMLSGGITTHWHEPIKTLKRMRLSVSPKLSGARGGRIKQAMQEERKQAAEEAERLFSGGLHSLLTGLPGSGSNGRQSVRLAK